MVNFLISNLIFLKINFWKLKSTLKTKNGGEFHLIENAKRADGLRRLRRCRAFGRNLPSSHYHRLEARREWGRTHQVRNTKPTKNLDESSIFRFALLCQNFQISAPQDSSSDRVDRMPRQTVIHNSLLPSSCSSKRKNMISNTFHFCLWRCLSLAWKSACCFGEKS